MHARLTVRLDVHAPFWERAHRVAAAEDAIRSFAGETRQQNPAFELRRSLPSVTVTDPEAHRPSLLFRFQQRAQSVLNETGAALPEWLARPVEQRSLTLEEVELVLRA